VERFIPHQSDAWAAAQEALAAYFARVGKQHAPAPDAALNTQVLLDLAGREPPEAAGGRIGPFLDAARLLGRRTAELHLALASDRESREFRPQPFTPYYQRSLYQALRRLTSEALYALHRYRDTLPAALQADAAAILQAQAAIMDHFKRITTHKITATRTRCHGDFRLAQVLYAAGDFVFIDFEGEPARVLAERRLKRSPLRDVASMLRSFHYAAGAALDAVREREGGVAADDAPPRRDDPPAGWARYWVQQVSAGFLGEYLRVAGPASFVPQAAEERFMLLDTLLLEQMLIELDRAVRHRPALAAIPLRSLRQFV
jgi:maltose alpha-D-glucosyltransferase/alpha-amylase